MIKPRIIPCLLIREKGLVKTKKFKDYKYLGDPINAVKTFNEKLVDELMVIDIDATSKNKELDLNLIKKFSEEARMPLCYAGGVKKVSDVKAIIELGVEKVGMSYGAISNPSLIKNASELVGSQSIVIVLDVKKKILGGYSVFTHNGTKDTGRKPEDLIEEMQEQGAGEIIINSIDNDGMMEGYDHNLIKKIKDKIKIPLTIIGGAGNKDHIKKVIERFGLLGIGAGSLFVFKGKYNAVLISYLSAEDKEEFNEIIRKKN